MKTKEIVAIAPTGFLGFGFSFEDFKKTLKEKRPDYIAVDAGSTDPGPYYLGSGEPIAPYETVKQELEVIIEGALEYNIPLIIGSAGGGGGRPHVDLTVEIIRDLTEEKGWSFPIATIDAEIEKETLHKWLKEDRIRTFESSKGLTSKEIDNSHRVVAQMGMEPIIKAIETDAQIIVCGRAVDDSVFAAYPVMKGYDKGLSTHMGKILECGALASEPLSMDVMTGSVRKDHFILEPGAEHRKCTVTSVTGHSLYERENPLVQAGPGGHIDLTESKVLQESDRTVKVSNTKYKKTDSYFIKLEGVEKAGYRTFSLAGVRDPVMVKNIDSIIVTLREHVNKYIDRMGYKDFNIEFHLYGKNAVMKELEPFKHNVSHELGVLIDVVASTQEQASAICQQVSGKLLHLDFPNQYNSSGNLAFPFSPSEIEAGVVYTFSIYHLAEVDNPCENFPVKVFNIEKGKIKEEVELK